MKNKLRLSITISVLFIFASATFGQRIISPKPEPLCLNAVSARLNAAQEKLAKMEAEISKIQSKRVYSESQANSIVQTMNEYGDDMTIAFEESLKSVERVARKNPRTGGEQEVSQLENFEKTAIEHQRRVEAIVGKLTEIEKAVENRQIRTDEKTVTDNKLTDGKLPADLKLNDSVFLQQASFLPRQESFENDVEILNAFFVGKSVALPCVAPCKNKNWSACIACVAPISCQINSQINQFNSCWSNCDGKKWWQRPACKAACLVNFVKWIA